MNNSPTATIKTIPDGYTSVTPWIISSDSAKLIQFLTAAFGAAEIPNSRITNDEGIIIHVVVKIGNALVMLFDSRKDWPASPAYLNLYVEDIDKAYQQALALGAQSVTNISTLWFGEKVCRIIDPFGNLWWINQRVEEIDFTNLAEVGARASTPEAIAGIAYIQQSLDEAMKIQTAFLK
jgi:PhnB protein